MENLLSALKDGHSLNVTGLRGSAPALLAARAIAAVRRPLCCITATEHQAALLEQDLALFTELPVFLYPGYEIPPYTPLSPDNRTVAARLATLYRMLSTDGPFIVIASAEALLRRVLPKDKLAGLAELVIAGEETDQHELAKRLAAAGYESTALVQTVGEFSVRGGIFDFFAPGFEYPLRLDFFGDTVESIRFFDPISQRSIDELTEAVILPVSDILFPAPGSPALAAIQEQLARSGATRNWDPDKLGSISERIASLRRFPGIEFFLPLFYEHTATLIDYLPDNAIFLALNPFAISSSINLTWERIEANYQESAGLANPALLPAELFLSETDCRLLLADRQSMLLYDFSGPGMADHPVHNVSCGNHALIRQEIELTRKRQGLLPVVTRHVQEWLAQGERVFLSCRSERHARHMADLLRQYDVAASVATGSFGAADHDPDQIVIYPYPLAEGFDLAEERLHFLSEGELFGELRLGSRKKARKAAGEAVRFEELTAGDIVVHRDHGLGIYQGLLQLELNGIANDFLQIAYKDDDKLYVPVDQLNVVSKYKGLTDKEPKLDKLGGKSWTTARKKVKEAVWKVAQDLLDLYARRHLEQGHAFSKPDELFLELEESFPFDETAGQLKAINDVIDDLTSEQPMDRLVCGDVGYGKTEVAVRAAFKVVEDGSQVALLVPTTVLAEQHAATFRDRLQGFPVRVESLSRFRSSTEQKKIIKDLGEGRIDIVIGTHRLLSKDVSFKRLGLLVIDEEHRFGVTHKEKIKKLRARVDVLTLTATPIPRTLQLSLLGIRDLSVISSPPEHRRTVKTFIARQDDLVIKEAVVREVQRGGQVFVVHNRVRSIHEVARSVQKLVPEARIATAHGQMPAKQLEDVMVRFVRKEVDVLVCTTIIESGLDIPNANTIIIMRADRLGLAEIYQLRGRVGRGREQAYAYLLVPTMDGLSRDAQQRLRALMDYNELGGGFKLAMSDLQIRGGGNILGESQSGHIAAVGYDLYLDLLQRTVADLKQKAASAEEQHPADEIEPEINLQVSAYIPDTYIANIDQRYIAYRRITILASEDELFDFKDELEDRYGPLPAESDNLFQVVALKIMLRRLKIVKLEQGQNRLIVAFHADTPVQPQRILDLVAKHAGRYRFTPDAKLVASVDHLHTPQAVFAAAKNILHEIMQGDI